MVAGVLNAQMCWLSPSVTQVGDQHELESVHTDSGERLLQLFTDRRLFLRKREFTDRKVRSSNPTSASRLPLSRLGQPGSIPALVLPSGGMALDCKRFIINLGASWTKWLEREFTDRKVRSSNPTSASRLPLSRLGQPGSIPALVLPSGGMAVRQ
ncbi:hypothetical protein CSKR_110185 [Clonorchis sinensis]|uniref:Uncharacterized protein n=1 Tax=Clonorchis sinensis TaxID=79923 RepID=A0A3R7D818_CLOSI|nr:hypothetical protein CSKR_110185 [Clonorchis sinensis]